jgi:hypothetical protein
VVRAVAPADLASVAGHPPQNRLLAPASGGARCASTVVYDARLPDHPSTMEWRPSSLLCDRKTALIATPNIEPVWLAGPVFAEIHTRCGGDDAPRTLYVGATNTTPRPGTRDGPWLDQGPSGGVDEANPTTPKPSAKTESSTRQPPPQATRGAGRRSSC